MGKYTDDDASITVEGTLRDIEKREITEDRKMNDMIHHYDNADGMGYALNEGKLNHPKNIGWALNYSSLSKDIKTTAKKYANDKIKKIIRDKSSTSFCLLSISAKADDSGMIEILYHTLGKMIDPLVQTSATYNAEIADRKFLKSIKSGYHYFPLYSKTYGYHVLEFILKNESPKDVFTKEDVLYTMNFKNTESVFSSVIKSYTFRIWGLHSKEMSKILKRKIEKSIKIKPIISEIFPSYPMHIISGNYGDNDINLSISQYQLDKIEFPEKEDILNKLDIFVKNRTLYVNNHLKYRFSLLLYGKPGTGKTSFIYSYAIKNKMQILKLDSGLIAVAGGDNYRNNGLTGHAISSRIVEMIDTASTSPTIIILDELDLMLESSESVRKLLNIIDQMPENTILTATTNHIEKLPEALIRSGRFDNRYELHDVDYDCAKKICEDYGVKEIDKIIASFPQGSTRFNPADLVAKITEQMFYEHGIEYSHKENIDEE